MKKFNYWNNGQPRTAHVRGSGNKMQVRVSDNVVRMGKIKSDPDIDLYETVEIGERPSKYQQHGPVTLDNDGSIITATQAVVYKSLDQVQVIIKADIKNKRNVVVAGNIEWSPDGGTTTYIVQTDDVSQSKLTGAVLRTDKNGNPNQAWRMADNTIVDLNKAQFDAMAVAVGDHVDACYLQQAVLEAQIASAEDVVAILAIDIEAGWPVNPAVPEV